MTHPKSSAFCLPWFFAFPSFVRTDTDTDADPVLGSATTTHLRTTTVYDEISDRFMIPAVFWTDVAQKASGCFGGLEFQSEDGTQGYSMAMCPRRVLCEMGELYELRTDRYVLPVLD